MNAQAQAASGFLGRGPGFWAALFIIAMFGAGIGTFFVEGPARYAVMITPMGLLYPFIRASEARATANGCSSPAILRYNRRMLLASFAYVAAMAVAVSIHNSFQMSGLGAFALALLVTLPTFGMIWAMARYLVEEKDEYLRHRTILAALISLGLILAVGIFWGFLETFGVVPHICAWWVLPVWALGLGIAQLTLRIRRV